LKGVQAMFLTIIIILLGAFFFYITHNIIATLGFMLFIIIGGIKIFEKMDI
jgi:hypothetical protein